MTDDQASMYVVAASEKDAADGCLQMLEVNEQQYISPEIVSVEEYKKPEAPEASTSHLN